MVGTRPTGRASAATALRVSATVRVTLAVLARAVHDRSSAAAAAVAALTTRLVALEQFAQRPNGVVVEPGRGEVQRLERQRAVGVGEARRPPGEQLEVGAHRAHVAARHGAGQRLGRPVGGDVRGGRGHERLEQPGGGGGPQARRRRHQLTGLALQGHEEIARRRGGQVIQGLGFVGQRERPAAEPSGEPAAELDVGRRVAGDGHRHVAQGAGVAGRGEALQGMQRQDAGGDAAQRGEQVERPETAGVDGRDGPVGRRRGAARRARGASAAATS